MHDHLSSSDPGIALLCDLAGTVRTVIRNDFRDALAIAPGALFAQCAYEGSRGKAEALLDALRNDKMVNQWELHFLIGDRIETLVFMGACIEDSLFLMGAPQHDHLMRLFEDMSQLCNEEVNRFRSFIKDRVDEENNDPASITRQHFEELSRLNNELANTHRELMNKNRELERLNDQKNRFLGMAAHDLRNPLDVIKTYSSFLEQELGPSLSNEQQEFLGAIHASSEFMLGLLDDLLDLSKIEAGKLTLDRKPVELGRLVLDNVKRNRVIAQKKRIRIDLEAGDNLPAAFVDEQKVEQVMNNLISNAIKYSHPGSEVKVELGKVDRYLSVAVIDQGQGIASEEMEKLFLPFTTTKTRSTSGEKSTGLGLMIVKKVVEGHEGEILVESEPGKGSTFTVLLPMTSQRITSEDRSVAPVEDRSGPVSEEKKSLKILIAEDNLLNQAMLLKVLDRIGYEADAVADGSEVVAALETTAYDLILMDLNMPTMDGMETARHIRDRLSPENRPHILAVTADEADEVRQRCLDAGMDGFIGKPINIKTLESELLDIARLRACLPV